jgi:type II secretory ATPase GspE/PulE/Tfp pilus assembly ATPase PilB-like protein
MKVRTDGTTHGQRLQLHVVQELARTRLEDLGMPDDLRGRLEKINAVEAGLIIVSAPPGNGLTSTLYSLLRKHDAFMQQLATLESVVTVELENITQQTYRDQTELTGQLGSLLRRDPDVVMLDGCKTPQTAKLICQAAGSKNFLLGMGAENSFVALAKWIKVCGDRPTAVAPLRAITCQVLLRALCPDCREAYRPPQALLAKLNLPADRIEHFYRPPTRQLTDEKGKPVVCPTCRGTGYRGRTAAFELLEMTEAIRELIVQDASLSQIKSACRKNKMLYLQEQALRKVIAGATSIEEVVRVSKSKQK